MAAVNFSKATETSVSTAQPKSIISAGAYTSASDYYVHCSIIILGAV